MSSPRPGVVMLRRVAARIRDRAEGALYQAGLRLLGVPVDGGEGGEADSGSRRRQRLAREGLGPIREAWWDQTRLEPRRNTWRYVLMMEMVEDWNRREGPADQREGDPERILVLQLGHIGDLVHTTPLLRRLRGVFAGSRIDMVTGPWTADAARLLPQVNEVIAYCPDIEQLHRGDRRECRSRLGELSLLRMLRDREYDLLVSCGPTNLVELFFIHGVRPRRWLGVASPAGDLYPQWSQALTVTYDSREYEARRLLALLELLGIKAGDDLDLELHLDDAARRYGEEAAGRLRRLGVGGPLIAVVPGAGWRWRRWPVERYAELIGRIAARRRDVGFLVLGTGTERRLGGRLAAVAPGRVLNLAGRTTLLEAAGVVGAADVFVGSDSGLLHVAAALGKPTVGLFGPMDPRRWAPRGGRHAVLYHRVECRGCLPWHPRSRCRDDGACMRAIGVEEVEHALEVMLEGGGSAAVAAG